LKKKFSTIYGYDPVVDNALIEKLGVIPVTIEGGFSNADCIIIMNNHNSYLNLDMTSLLAKVSKPCLLVDTWKMFGDLDVDGIIITSIGIN